MGRRKQILPTLRFHKPTGQHYYWDGVARKRVNLGANAERAERRYKAAIAKLASGAQDAGTQAPARDPATPITVAELTLDFRRRVVPDYADSRAVARIDAAIKWLCKFAGEEVADRFLAQRLKEFRRFLIGCNCEQSGLPYRLTRQALCEALEEHGRRRAESVVGEVLQTLTRLGVVDNRQDVSPKGYGLPEF